MSDLAARISDAIARVPDFPKPGILFYDVMKVLETRPDLFSDIVDDFAKHFEGLKPTKIASMEARGFLFGAPLAVALGIGFVPLRKPGKLPRETTSYTYDLEYGQDTLAVHKESLVPGDRVLIIDDLLATGGTAAAAVALVRSTGAQLVGAGFVIEIDDLKGSVKFNDVPTYSILHV